MGMTDAEGVAAKLFDACRRKNQFAHDYYQAKLRFRFWLIVRMLKSVDSLAFGLDGWWMRVFGRSLSVKKSDPLEVVRRLGGMEDLAIEDCQLDMSQATVTFLNLPGHLGSRRKYLKRLDGPAQRRHDRTELPRNGRAEISFTFRLLIANEHICHETYRTDRGGETTNP